MGGRRRRNGRRARPDGPGMHTASAVRRARPDGPGMHTASAVHRGGDGWTGEEIFRRKKNFGEENFR